MPTPINSPSDLQPGDIYEDSYSHPCLCIKIEDNIVSGISLVDGTTPRSDSLEYNTLRKLSVDEAWQWRINGPPDKEISAQAKWWGNKLPHQINPAVLLENLYFFTLYQVEWHEELRNLLGAPIKHEWHNVSSNIIDNGDAGTANISFEVIGQTRNGIVHVKASKNEAEWLFDDLFVNVGPDNERIFIIQDGNAYSL